MRESLFSFPNPVNEVAARLVAGGVVLMCVTTIAFDLPWMTAVIAYGFVARVLTGHAASPRSGKENRKRWTSAADRSSRENPAIGTEPSASSRAWPHAHAVRSSLMPSSWGPPMKTV